MLTSYPTPDDPLQDGEEEVAPPPAAGQQSPQQQQQSRTPLYINVDLSVRVPAIAQVISLYLAYCFLVLVAASCLTGSVLSPFARVRVWAHSVRREAAVPMDVDGPGSKVGASEAFVNEPWQASARALSPEAVAYALYAPCTVFLHHGCELELTDTLREQSLLLVRSLPPRYVDLLTDATHSLFYVGVQNCSYRPFEMEEEEDEAVGEYSSSGSSHENETVGRRATSALYLRAYSISIPADMLLYNYTLSCEVGGMAPMVNLTTVLLTDVNESDVTVWPPGAWPAPPSSNVRPSQDLSNTAVSASASSGWLRESAEGESTSRDVTADLLFAQAALGGGKPTWVYNTSFRDCGEVLAACGAGLQLPQAATYIFIQKSDGTGRLHWCGEDLLVVRPSVSSTTAATQHFLRDTSRAVTVCTSAYYEVRDDSAISLMGGSSLVTASPSSASIKLPINATTEVQVRYTEGLNLFIVEGTAFWIAFEYSPQAILLITATSCLAATFIILTLVGFTLPVHRFQQRQLRTAVEMDLSVQIEQLLARRRRQLDQRMDGGSRGVDSGWDLAFADAEGWGELDVTVQRRADAIAFQQQQQPMQRSAQHPRGNGATQRVAMATGYGEPGIELALIPAQPEQGGEQRQQRESDPPGEHGQDHSTVVYGRAHYLPRPDTDVPSFHPSLEPSTATDRAPLAPSTAVEAATRAVDSAHHADREGVFRSAVTAPCTKLPHSTTGSSGNAYPPPQREVSVSHALSVITTAMAATTSQLPGALHTPASSRSSSARSRGRGHEEVSAHTEEGDFFTVAPDEHPPSSDSSSTYGGREEEARGVWSQLEESHPVCTASSALQQAQRPPAAGANPPDRPIATSRVASRLVKRKGEAASQPAITASMGPSTTPQSTPQTHSASAGHHSQHQQQPPPLSTSASASRSQLDGGQRLSSSSPHTVIPVRGAGLDESVVILTTNPVPRSLRHRRSRPVTEKLRKSLARLRRPPAPSDDLDDGHHGERLGDGDDSRNVTARQETESRDGEEEEAASAQPTTLADMAALARDTVTCQRRKQMRTTRALWRLAMVLNASVVVLVAIGYSLVTVPYDNYLDVLTQYGAPWADELGLLLSPAALSASGRNYRSRYVYSTTSLFKGLTLTGLVVSAVAIVLIIVIRKWQIL